MISDLRPRVSKLVCVLNFNLESGVWAEIMQCHPKRMRYFSTICVNKNGNRKWTNIFFSNLFAFMGELEITL